MRKRPLRSRLWKAWTVLAGCFCFGALQTALGASFLKVDPLVDGGGVEVRINPSRQSAPVLLEVLDPQSGRCLRTVHAGPVPTGQTAVVGKKERLANGAYRLRYREGIRLEYELSLNPPGGEKWINPTDVQVADKGVYVLDSGKFAVSRKTPDGEVKAPTEEEVLADCSHLYRFLSDGKPDPSFGYQGRQPVSAKAVHVRSFVVDPEGQVYLGSGHTVRVFSVSGKPLGRVIGGWDKDPLGPKCTGAVNSLALGPGRRIYISTYGRLRIYDRTKEGFAGVLGTTVPPSILNVRERVVASDGEGTLYLLNQKTQLQRFDDNGAALELKHVSPLGLKIARPSGPSASAGLIWLADRGPGTPFWDSSGNEILLFWDDGGKVLLVDHFGGPGTGKDDKLEFVNPSATAMTPDHLFLWIVEDGLPNEDGPPGAARIRKFRIAADQTEEVSFEIRSVSR